MAKIKEKVAIIILNYNGLPHVLDCLQSLNHSSIINHQSLIILVDNHSIDASVETIKKKFPQVKIIRNKKNLGFAGGNNVGIKWALKNNFDYLMLLNPDTIVEKDFLAPLIRLMKSDKTIGVVSPLLQEKKQGKTIFSLGAEFNPLLGRTKHLQTRVKPSKSLEQELVSGCAMLIKKEVFEKIGLFDERFFLYFEDSDFCLRARKAGFKIFLEPKSIVFHKISQSFRNFPLKKIYFNLKSNLLFIHKQVKPCFWPLAYFYLFVLAGKMLMAFVLGS
jgi:GT2 family glycosyltransferase